MQRGEDGEGGEQGGDHVVNFSSSFLNSALQSHFGCGGDPASAQRLFSLKYACFSSGVTATILQSTNHS